MAECEILNLLYEVIKLPQQYPFNNNVTGVTLGIWFV